MKRFQVLDLFYGSMTEEVDGDWNEINYQFTETLPKVSSKNGKVKVKLQDGTETLAYYCSDKMMWLEKTSPIKPCYFWHSKNHEPLNNVTHWKYLKEKD